MVTRIHKSATPRLFLREHRKAKSVSAEAMGGRLGMERESVLRLEREWRTRCTPEKQAQYAAALDMEPEDLWRPPLQNPQQSLDRLVEKEPAATQAMIFDVVKRMVGGAS